MTKSVVDKVYVLIDSPPFDGGEVIGVYSSKEYALSEMKRARKTIGMDLELHEFHIDVTEPSGERMPLFI